MYGRHAGSYSGEPNCEGKKFAVTFGISYRIDGDIMASDHILEAVATGERLGLMRRGYLCEGIYD